MKKANKAPQRGPVGCLMKILWFLHCWIFHQMAVTQRRYSAAQCSFSLRLLVLRLPVLQQVAEVRAAQ